MEIRALRFHGVDDLRLETVELREPQPGDVVASVDACGVCGSDLHFLDGSARTGRIPVTLGHEIAATVIDSADQAWQSGDSVLVAAAIWCGTCDRCSEGRSNLCRRLTMVGIDVDGGLADAIVIPASSLVHRPREISAAIAATTVDAGLTAYHAVTRRGRIGAGDSVAVIGAGAIGTFGLQFSKLAGAAPIIVVDRDPAALALARDLGADEVIVAEEGLSIGREVKMLTDGGVDVALEFVGRAQTVDAAVKSLRPGGRAVAVGIGNEPLATVPPVLWATQEYELVGSFGGLPTDAAAVLDLVTTGSVKPPPLHSIALAEAGESIRSLARGETVIQGRMIVEP